MKTIILSAFLLCFGSFAWAMYGGFFKIAGTLSRGGITVRIVSTICWILQLIVITRTGSFYEQTFMISLVLYSLSVVLFWATISANRRIEFHHCFTVLTPQRFVNSGPYRYVRHPFYLSYTLSWVAGALVGDAPWLWLTVLAMGWLYWRAASMEEQQFLSSSLAPVYQHYTRSTGFMFPRFDTFFVKRQ
jgi:protein-S-isoprenylcysteine O-methyltransferase Ste14